MREINKIILHCSASDNINQTAAMIDSWHRQRGWSKIGYHYFIRPNGLIEGGRAVEEIGAHVRGQNHDSIGICVAGNMRFADVQFESLKALLLSLARIWPKATVFGHNEFNKKKLCPIYRVDKFRALYERKESKSTWKFSVILELLRKLFSR